MSNEALKLTNDQLMRAAFNMEQNGGHFAAALARAFYAADSGNRRRILEAFGHMFVDYYLPFDIRQTYNEQRAEARACGHEFPDFEEWLDPSLTRRRAQNRLRLEAEDYDLD